MNNLTNCFVAYAANPLSIAEDIELALSIINRAGEVRCVGWKSLGVTGKIIIDEVCAAIRDCDLFICDMTNLNMNVLFELGYAIMQDKRIWVTVNPSYPRAREDYKKLSLLSTLGCTYYQNSYELAETFLRERPFTNLESTIYKRVIQSGMQSQRKHPTLCYLKSDFKTSASLRLTRRLQDSKMPLMTDDPEEVSTHPLTWYAQIIYQSFAVVAHLIDEERAPTSKYFQNAKYSLVAGMAHGCGKPLLILAHAPFSPPIDYRDMMIVHETATACVSAVDSWLPTIEREHARLLDEYRKQQADMETAVGLRKINLGEYIAENEELELADYFVVTAPYSQALKVSQYTIYVGRKGSGKTANLYQMARTLEEDKRNHVCIIKPVDYELEGVFRLLTSNLAKADPGYLIESLWKFLVYTELAISIHEQLVSKPKHFDYDKAEVEFMRYLDERQDLIEENFTARMEYAIQELCEIDSFSNVRDQRAKVSEILHSRPLGVLREHLGKVLEKRNKVVLLIDNLDKAWLRRENLDLMSQFLFGLLSAGQAISKDFRQGRRTRPRVNLSLIIFLRGDIFSYIRQAAREGDKIAFTVMDWNDPLLLQRVIEERFTNSLGDTFVPEGIWQRFFVPAIEGLPTKDYIVSRIIPRPRDIIYLCKSALSHAINHKHTRIEQDDILQAEIDYSAYAFESLKDETGAQFGEIEELLYEFVGANAIVTRDDIDSFIKKANISEERTDYAIELLCDSTFLGLETRPGSFEFLYEVPKKRVFQKLAQAVAEQGGEQRFMINIPFHAYLEINGRGDSI
jgi:Cdc6-like AAA superfamily ATPase